ncbi:protein SlyX [Methylobacterium gnaphalii]|uniref:Protein SlyX n=2 Tax=Methylobacterium gnaphalii TaxID=1010610 RepID=A0A512JN30_9HYPH|nr:protein SlyX [Methylobacterium gnaphalii]GLS47965.1 protein SlyX [Methylobacterium gnaphalii]
MGLQQDERDPMTDDPHGRIDRLEIRLTEQEATIEDLNATITAQWKKIDALVRVVQRLEAQIEEASARGATGGAEPPPPHY